MTWGHCGLLDLQCSGLAPPTPCRFYRRTWKTPFPELLEKFQGRRGVAPSRMWGTMQSPVARNEDRSNKCCDNSSSELSRATHPHKNSQYVHSRVFQRNRPVLAGRTTEKRTFAVCAER